MFYNLFVHNNHSVIPLPLVNLNNKDNKLGMCGVGHNYTNSTNGVPSQATAVVLGTQGQTDRHWVGVHIN